MYNNSQYRSITSRGELLTEKSNSKSQFLDKLSTSELVQVFSKEDIEPQKAVSEAISDIIKAINLIVPRLKEGGRLFYLGTGTSGRLGVLDAAECPPTFCSSPELIQGIIAGGDSALKKSSEALEDQESLSIEDLEAKDFCEKDVLIGITAGGTTPYVVTALSYAVKINALSIAISCVPINDVTLPCQVDIRLLTGPELLTGSTRLKAATATKMTLNMISTIVMIKLGKVYGNKMVDVSVTNSKLYDRAIRILQEIAKLELDEAQELLKQTNGSVKLSLLMALGSLGLEKANELLSENNYYLRPALEKVSKASNKSNHNC